MAGLVFFDINILLYAISSAPKEWIKRDRARELLESFEVGTSLQVIQDFHVNAIGKLKKTSRTNRYARHPNPARAIPEKWPRLTDGRWRRTCFRQKREIGLDDGKSAADRGYRSGIVLGGGCDSSLFRTLDQFLGQERAALHLIGTLLG